MALATAPGPMRVPGVDPPHKAKCIRCGYEDEWFGRRDEAGGKDTLEGFVCRACRFKAKREKALGTSAAASPQDLLEASGGGPR